MVIKPSKEQKEAVARAFRRMHSAALCAEACGGDDGWAAEEIITAYLRASPPAEDGEPVADRTDAILFSPFKPPAMADYRQGVLSVLRNFAEQEPDQPTDDEPEGESWESWYSAAFDMAAAEISDIPLPLLPDAAQHRDAVRAVADRLEREATERMALLGAADDNTDTMIWAAQQLSLVLDGHRRQP